MTRLNSKFAPVSPRVTNLTSLGRLMAAVLFLFCFSLTVASPGYAQVTIKPGTPKKDGVDGFTFYFKDGSNLFVGVKVKKGMSPIEKADAIQDEITTEAKKKGIAINVNIDAAGRVNVAGKAATATTKFSKAFAVSHATDSGEIDTFNTDSNGYVAAITDLHLGPTSTNLAGIDSNGDPAIYTVGYELTSQSFGDISLSTTLLFSDLITPTLSGLLQQEYDVLLAQLDAEAPSLANDLILNLTTDEILFQPNDIITNISVTNGTTDVALVSSLSLSTVPEPSTLILIATCLLPMLGAYRRPPGRLMRRHDKGPGSQYSL